MQSSHLELFFLHLSHQINHVLKLQHIVLNKKKEQKTKNKKLVDTVMVHSTPEMQVFTALDVEPKQGASPSQTGDSGDCQNISQFT